MPTCLCCKFGIFFHASCKSVDLRNLLEYNDIKPDYSVLKLKAHQLSTDYVT